MDGSITNQSRTEIQIQTDGGARTIQKSEILRITFGPSPDEERRRLEEQRLQEEQKRKLEEEARLRREEQNKNEEQRRREEERLKNEEARRLQEQQNAKSEEERKQQSLLEEQERQRREEALKRKFLDIVIGGSAGNESTQMTEQWSLYRYMFTTMGGLNPLGGTASRGADLRHEFRAGNAGARFTFNRWIFGASYVESISDPAFRLSSFSNSNGTYPSGSELRMSMHPLRKKDSSFYTAFSVIRKEKFDVNILISRRYLNQSAIMQRNGISYSYDMSSLISYNLPLDVQSYIRTNMHGWNPGLEFVWRPRPSSEIVFDVTRSSLYGDWDGQDFSLDLRNSGGTFNQIQIKARSFYKSYYFGLKYRQEVRNGWAFSLAGFYETGRMALHRSRIASFVNLDFGPTNTSTMIAPAEQLFIISMVVDKMSYAPNLKRRDEMRGITFAIEKRIDFLR